MYSRKSTKLTRRFKDNIQMQHTRKCLSMDVKAYRKAIKEYGKESLPASFALGSIHATVTAMFSLVCVLHEVQDLKYSLKMSKY